MYARVQYENVNKSVQTWFLLSWQLISKGLFLAWPVCYLIFVANSFIMFRVYSHCTFFRGLFFFNPFLSFYCKIKNILLIHMCIETVIYILSRIFKSYKLTNNFDHNQIIKFVWFSWKCRFFLPNQQLLLNKTVVEI